jgi:hypothetical protein
MRKNGQLSLDTVYGLLAANESYGNILEVVDGKIVLDNDKLQQLQHKGAEQEELQELQEFLANTDSVALQWLEEEELGIPHHKPKNEYKEMMLQRQTAREKIRVLKEGKND